METGAAKGARIDQLGGRIDVDAIKSPTDQQSPYPHHPGWREGPNSETSRRAAVLAGIKAPNLKHRILAMLADRPATPEELERRFAEAGEHVLLNTIRARCSDLHALGRVLPSGTYGLGESGKARVIRWRLTDEAERALFDSRKAAERSASEDRQ